MGGILLLNLYEIREGSHLRRSHAAAGVQKAASGSYPGVTAPPFKVRISTRSLATSSSLSSSLGAATPRARMVRVSVPTFIYRAASLCVLMKVLQVLRSSSNLVNLGGRLGHFRRDVLYWQDTDLLFEIELLRAQAASVIPGVVAALDNFPWHLYLFI